MLQHKCPACGWVFPSTYINSTCRFCHSPLLLCICPICGELKVPYSTEDLICKDCKAKQNRVLYNAKKKAYHEKLNATLIKRLTTPKFRALTEAEWLETCSYFAGCAYCGNSSIDARTYFIPFADGGRYTVWNVIPICEECAKQQNLFKRIPDVANIHKSKKESAQYISKIIKYLSSRVPNG